MPRSTCLTRTCRHVLPIIQDIKAQKSKAEEMCEAHKVTRGATPRRRPNLTHAMASALADSGIHCVPAVICYVICHDMCIHCVPTWLL